MPDSSTETRTYVGQTGTHAFDGYAGLRIGQRYTGVPQEDGSVLVSGVGVLTGRGVQVSADEWRLWFEK
jgi:hypothetical protein